MKFLSYKNQWKSLLVISHRSQHSQTHIEPLIMCCDKNQIRSTFVCTTDDVLFIRGGTVRLTCLVLAPFSLYSILFLISVFLFNFDYGKSICIWKKLHTSSVSKHRSNQWACWIQCCFRGSLPGDTHTKRTIQIGCATFALMNSSAFSFRQTDYVRLSLLNDIQSV